MDKYILNKETILFQCQTRIENFNKWKLYLAKRVGILKNKFSLHTPKMLVFLSAKRVVV